MTMTSWIMINMLIKTLDTFDSRNRVVIRRVLMEV